MTPRARTKAASPAPLPGELDLWLEIARAIAREKPDSVVARLLREWDLLDAPGAAALVHTARAASGADKKGRRGSRHDAPRGASPAVARRAASSS
jgi:hypothetical protein